MEKETFITVSIAEYKELLEFKIRSEYEDKIRALQEESKELRENRDYWFNQYCKRNSELDALQQVVAELKTELAEYKPAEKGGDA